jgi:hypothetical protein
VPRRNRVDPWGDLHAVRERGLFTGNRGCLVDDAGEVVRHHRGQLWITCVTEYQGWRHPLDAPRRWTPIFFLDDAVALAAGHRPCGLCRRSDYLSYRDAVSRSGVRPVPGAVELNRLLAGERLQPAGGAGVANRNRGFDRARDRITWPALVDTLPIGTVIVDSDRSPQLVLKDRLATFAFSGWSDSNDRPSGGTVEVLTPPTSVAALRHGFVPTLHPSADV